MSKQMGSDGRYYDTKDFINQMRRAQAERDNPAPQQPAQPEGQNNGDGRAAAETAAEPQAREEERPAAPEEQAPQPTSGNGQE